jgi:uncharacterized membrane protein YkvA (DUF1232 family)
MRTWVVILIAVAAVYLAIIVALLVAGRRIAARELALLVPNLVLLFKDLLRDPDVPRGARWALGIAAVWLASPIDLLPEFLPFLGPLDDAVVAALVLRYLVRRAGPEVVRRHWRGEPRTLEIMLRAARVA